ncbi:unnamed protein product [Orchesella dallaii]|uniref:RING-type domain-containing protein n=1 Tax=Orchesella dallaii TaxID=48710 RepID=A0ABP1QZW2_9HEXA
MDQEVQDHLTCPVCYEVPENEVFQCHDGHTVCGRCSRNLVACPQCRAPYGVRKIRNRALEAILECQEFECQFKDLGCTEKFPRRELSNHIQHCQYNADTACVCKHLGYPNCTFAPGFNRAETIAHFLEHGVLIRNGPEMHISLKNFSFYLEGGMDTSGNPEEKQLLPVLMNLEGNGTGPLFLILSKITTNGFMAWTCIQVWKNDEIRTERCSFFIVLKFKNSSRNFDGIRETPKLEYALRPIADLHNAKPFLKTYPLQIPTALIYEKVWDRERNCIKVGIRVTESQEFSEEDVDALSHLEETLVLCPRRGTPNVGLLEARIQPPEMVEELPTTILLSDEEEFPALPNPLGSSTNSTQPPEMAEELPTAILLSDEEEFPALPNPLGSSTNSTQRFNRGRFNNNRN